MSLVDIIEYRQVTSTRLNKRAGPSTRYKRVGQWRRGDVLAVTGFYAEDTNRLWAAVIDPDGPIVITWAALWLTAEHQNVPGGG